MNRLAEIRFHGTLLKGKASFGRFSKLQNEIINHEDEELTLSINSKERVGLTFAFLVGCLPLLAESNEKKLKLTINTRMFEKMVKINIIDYYKYSENLSKNLIENPLPCFRKINKAQDIFTLVKEIGKEAPIEMNEKLEEIFTSRLGEMYLNALEHSGAQYIMGGKYFNQQKNKYCFSCYDTGVGIIENVNKYHEKLENSLLSDVDALKWAMSKGNSTAKNKDVPRGVGMGLLKKFAQLNEGTIEICSGRTLYICNKNGEYYYQLDHEFQGTLFQMNIIADNNYTYTLK